MSKKLFLNFILILLSLQLQAASKKSSTLKLDTTHIVAGYLPDLVDTSPEEKISIPLYTDYLAYNSDSTVEPQRYILNNLPVGLALDVVKDDTEFNNDNESPYLRVNIPKEYQTCIIKESADKGDQSDCPTTALIKREQMTLPNELDQLEDKYPDTFIKRYDGDTLWKVEIKDRELTSTDESKTEAVVESTCETCNAFITSNLELEDRVVSKTGLSSLREFLEKKNSNELVLSKDLKKEDLKEYFEDKYSNYSKSQGVDKTIKYLTENVGTWGHVEKRYKDKEKKIVETDYEGNELTYTDSYFCWGALKRAMVDKGKMFPNYPPNSEDLSEDKKHYPLGNADNAGHSLRTAGFVNILTEQTQKLGMSCDDAPRGAVCHYACVDGGKDCYGHTEMRTDNGFISSYDSTVSRTEDAARTGTRKLIGIYVKDIKNKED